MQADRSDQAEFNSGVLAYQKGLYQEAIVVFSNIASKYPNGHFAYEAHWMLAKSYEASGDIQSAISEYMHVRSQFPQTHYGSEALEKIQTLQKEFPTLTGKSSPAPSPTNEYYIGQDDELDISVYGDKDLSKIQTVRPDGKISFPLVGDIVARGMTPDALRETITQKLSLHLRNPHVTVIITKYNSKPVYVLGEVKKPGLLRLSSDINLLEAISRVEGVNESADLQGSLLVRDGRIVPVNFEKLLRRGDFSQNVLLNRNDVILIPNISAKKVFVMGEVNKPLVVTLKPGVTLIEAISMAGGFTRDAEMKNVLIVRGGLGDPKLLTVNASAITKGATVQDVLLQSGDIVYVPKTLVANVVKYFQDLTTILTPVILAETGIVLYPGVKSVLKTGEAEQVQPVVIGR